MQEKLTGAAHGKEIAIHCAADRGSLAVELQVVNMGMAGQPDADFDCTVACVLLGFVQVPVSAHLPKHRLKPVRGEAEEHDLACLLRSQNQRPVGNPDSCPRVQVSLHPP